ncbi:MAG: TetR/AcrR family transcriptional regulator [Bacilli bacterium]|nr:TetR/AcrR family transcriptional regulator [Bacilli bacterium]
MRKNIEDVREQIVLGTIDEFNKRGPALRLDDVAKNLHISKKTIYKVFKSKEAIIAYIGESIIEEIAKEADRIYHDPSIPMLRKIEEILSIDVRYEKLFDRKASIYHEKNYPHIAMYMERKSSLLSSYFEKLLLEAKKEGAVREEVPVRFVKNIYYTLSRSFFSGELAKDSELTSEEARSFLTSIILNGTMKKN